MAEQNNQLDPAVPTPAILAANRLEARPRSAEFNRALRAEIRDSLWLLARQWQLREYRAEDRGSPAFVETIVEELPITQLGATGQALRPYTSRHQPLEAAVEAQPRPIGLGLRLQMGQYWLRQLRSLPALKDASPAARAAAMHTFALVYPLPVVSPAAPVEYALATSDSEAYELLQLAGPSAFDGYAFYQALLGPHLSSIGTAIADSDYLAVAIEGVPLMETLLAATSFSNTADPTIVAGVALLASSSEVLLEAQARNFILAFHRLYLLGAESTNWSTERMAYAAALGTTSTVQLATTHYEGGAEFPWYAVDQQFAATSQLPAALPAARRLLATEVQFPGSPSARWWEFEDRRVDFGQVSGDPSDWGRMLLQEFMFLYQNDWFTVPYSVSTGSISIVQSLLVTDVFGLRYAIQPAGAGQLVEPGTELLVDNDANQWRLFAQTGPAPSGPAVTPQLYVPATALAPMVSAPIEQISFHREEATNLVWAVEHIVPGSFAGGLDGATAAAKVAETLRGLVPAPSTSNTVEASASDYEYQLVSSIPENWLPFLPMAAAEDGVVLEQGVFERQVPGMALTGNDATVQPRTALLQMHPTAPYRVQEQEVSPTGMRVEANCYRARWYGGRTVLWFGRRRAPVQNGGSSGLAFDQLRVRGTV